MDSAPRPRLTPAIADVRRAVRQALPETGLVLVALSGGPDSLALAAATAFEAQRAGIRAGAVIVDHGLQTGSADVAARAAEQARSLGLDPVTVTRVVVETDGGPEAAARTARYAALDAVAGETGAGVILLGHTLDDQAETVLLGLARGSGPTSLHGMAATGGGYARPLLSIRRATTVQFCVDSELEPWTDPQNSDDAFARARVRSTVLPMLERELGPGVAEALARTAVQLREDSDALDHFAQEIAEELADLAESGISLPVKALASNPAALRQRLIRLAVESEFHVSLSRAQQASVRAFVAAQGWTLVAEFSDVASGKDDRRPGFQAALARCRQLGAVLAAARLDRITRRAHTLSQLLEDGYSVRAADMPGADDLMMRVYAAMAQKERELISERTRAALTAARARGAVLGGDRGYRPSVPPCAARAASARGEVADQVAHRLSLEIARLQGEGISTLIGLARALTERGVPTPRGDGAWTHTTVARLMARVAG